MLSVHHAQLLRVQEISNAKPLEFYGDTSDTEVETIQFLSIGINEVRRITQVASLRPEVAKIRLLVVTTTSVTLEAQQALLKILEEPPLATKFLFVLPLDLILLPTLASRFQLIENFTVSVEGEVFTNFYQLSYGDRLAEITKRMTKKDLVWTMEIRRSLVEYLNQKASTLPVIKLRTLNMIMEKLGTRGASNKMLLEELALTLPISN